VCVRGSLRRASECDHFLELHRSDPSAIRRDLEEQFKALQGRSHVLLGICGVLLTASVLITTGRIISKGNYALARAAGWLLALAGLCDIMATFVIVAAVLNIQWITRMPNEDLRTWIARAIAYRDHKTLAYHFALGVVLLSMLFYQAAVLIVVLQL
jgi:hypothetical protein